MKTNALILKSFYLLILFLMVESSSAQSNLVLNAGFSNESQNWQTNCSIEINPETVYGGGNASNYVSEIDKERCFSQNVNITAGAIYLFSYKAARRLNGAPSTVGVTVKVTGVQSGTNYINTNKTYKQTTWNFTTEYFSFTIPLGSIDKSVRISFSNYITTGTYGTLIDDVTLRLDPEYLSLPLKFSTFKGSMDKNTASLKWVADNIENDGQYFIVEKMTAEDKFDSIGIVIAKTTGNNYAYNDKKLLNGKNQYRLKAVNQDGSFTYSNIISLDNKSAVEELSIYPNPANSIINCAITSPLRTSITINVYNVSGAVLTSKKVEINAGFNKISIDINMLQTGSFFLKVVDGNDLSYVKSFYKK